MKFHLPICLFRSVIALMVAVPSVLYAAYTVPTDIVIPEQYTIAKQVDALADISAYSSSASDMAFRLEEDLVSSAFKYELVKYSAGSRYFTSHAASALKSMSFIDFNSRLFYVKGSESLEFAALQNLIFNGTSTGSYQEVIYGTSSSTIMLRDNGRVSFSGNPRRAIYGYSYSSIELCDNGTVSFSGNSYGAIYGGSYSSVALNGNGTVSFSGNSGSRAIYENGGDVALNGNGTVSFSGNSGGAIYGDDAIRLRNNGTVIFSGNTAKNGGAIEGDDIVLSRNNSVEFYGNTAQYSGGAIYGVKYGTINLSDNKTVSFSGNTASNGYYGGAIYIDRYGELSIRNNESVEFARNLEKASGRLRSIYISGSGGSSVLSLSAAVGKSITFRDSIYIGNMYNDIGWNTVALNADYTDAVGNTIKQQGDIIFTGATTEADLLAVKGSSGTAAEVLNSRTSEVYDLTNLYGGRLCVEDGAVYKGYGITVHEGTEATVRVKDATLDHSGYSLSFYSGTRLDAEGNSYIRGDVELYDGARMNVKGTVTLGGWLSLKSGSSVASVEGVRLRSDLVSGYRASSLMQDVWMESRDDVYSMAGVTLQNVHFSAALATLTLTDVSFDTACSFSVGAEGSIILSGATLCLTLPEAGEGGIYRVDLSHLFQCTVEGDLSFDVDTEALAAAGYTGVELDFGSDADEDYSGLSLTMDGATYEGTEGNVAGFTLPTVPEPATATLSLLALAALAARRRRG